MRRKELLSVPQLKGRNWTKSMIQRFLPNHDSQQANPMYTNARKPMKLYSTERVLQIENTAAFAKALQESKKRKEAAAKSVSTKLQKMADYIENLEIEVPEYSRDELIRRAQQNFSSMNYRHNFETSIERKCVNYLRHCCSCYEKCLEKIAGKVGARDGYFEIKEMVLYEILFRYPWLEEECKAQLKKLSEKRNSMDLNFF